MKSTILMSNLYKNLSMKVTTLILSLTL